MFENIVGKGENAGKPAFSHFHTMFSTVIQHVRKVVGGFGKKSCASTGVRKPGNTCFIDRHDVTLAVKVTLNPNTTNQPTLSYREFGNIKFVVCKFFKFG